MCGLSGIWALNELTVKEFPIPIVDELIGELHGAQYFSKILDLVFIKFVFV